MANDARWTVVFGGAREREDGTRHADIAIPVFAYKSRASIDRRHGFIRRWEVSDAAAHDGRMLRRGLLDKTDTGATVWADSAYPSKASGGWSGSTDGAAAHDAALGGQERGTDRPHHDGITVKPRVAADRRAPKPVERGSHLVLIYPLWPIVRRILNR